MRASTAYFAGVGTVVVAIAAGLGGGVILANVMNPNSSRQQATRLEQRISPQPLAASSKADEMQQQQPKAPAPDAAASQGAATTAASAKNQPQEQPEKQPHPVQTNSSPANAATPAPQSGPREQAAAADGANSRDGNKDVAKPRNADARPQVDQRKVDRQRQWADRRKHDQQQREQDFRNAQAGIQDDDGPRDVVVRRDWRDDRRGWRDDRDAYAPPPRFGFPGLNMFGPDD